jgi:hypothetical protein
MVDQVAKRFVALALALFFLCSVGMLAQETQGKAEGTSPALWAADALKSLNYQDPYGSGIQDAMKFWLDKTAWADEQQQKVLLTLPDLKKAGTKGLTKYDGQEPVGYIAQLYALLPQQIMNAPAKKPVELAASSAADLTSAVQTFVNDVDAYIANAFKKMQVYKAFSRISLPLEKADTFQTKQFKDKTQAPVFKKNLPVRKELKKGDKGTAVRTAQQALIVFGYYTDKAGSTYNDAMVQAVAEFLKTMKLSGDGTVLTLEMQSLLLGREDTFNHLMEALAQELVDQKLEWRGKELDTVKKVTAMLKVRFPVFLHTIYLANWSLDAQSPLLSYKIVPLQSVELGWYAEMAEQYMKLEVSRKGMEKELNKRISALWTTKGSEPQGAEDGVLRLDFTESTKAVAAWAEDFTAFHMTYEDLLAQVNDYMDTHPAPLPQPKNKVLKKPGSGGSRFAIRNGGEDPIYIRIYKMKSANDTGKGKYVGSAFVSPNGKVSMSIAPGYYRVTYGSGTYWYGEEEMFGDDGYYMASEDIYKFQNNYIHTLSLRVEKGGGKSVEYNDISPDEM